MATFINLCQKLVNVDNIDYMISHDRHNKTDIIFTSGKCLTLDMVIDDVKDLIDSIKEDE